MNPGQGTWWPADLDYAEPEQVRLDIAAIIAQGTRLRRRRLLTRVAALVLLCGLAPTAILIVKIAQDPPANTVAGRNNVVRHSASPVPSGHGYGTANGISTTDVSLRQAGVAAKMTLPARYGPLHALAGDLAGPGVWFWAAASRITLFHLSRRGTLKSWPVPRTTGDLSGRSQGGFTVTVTGVAWLGLNSTLVRIDASTGRVRSWHIPPARGTAHRPGRQAVQSLTTNSYGLVAITLSDASGVRVFDQWTERFSQVLLPSRADQARSAGFARNGTLGVSFTRLGSTAGSGVELVTPGKRRVVAAVADTDGVVPYGRSSLIVGVSQPDLVAPTGAVTPLVRLDDLVGAVSAPAEYGPATEFAATSQSASLPGNRLGTVIGPGVLTYPAGAVSVAAARTGSVLYLAPASSCGQDYLGLPELRQLLAPPDGSTCQQTFRLLATDSVGDIWVVPAGSDRTVELLKR
jgi:hypothetical protein